MIQLIQSGHYLLIETHGQTKILTLDGKRTFAWIVAGEIGEILVHSHRSHTVDHILSCGKYRMYVVRDEPTLADLVHLELLVGDGLWQGYLLPNGLPNEQEKKHRIIPTREIITKTTHYTPADNSSSSFRMSRITN